MSVTGHGHVRLFSPGRLTDTAFQERVDADATSAEEGHHERQRAEREIELVAALAPSRVDPVRGGHGEDRDHHVAEDRSSGDAGEEAERQRDPAEELDRATQGSEGDAGTQAG